MLWLQEKYLNQLMFKMKESKQERLSPIVWRFGCPYCGDGSRGRRRAYVYEKKNYLNFHCHNCGASATFFDFLADQDYKLFENYKLENLKERSSRRTKRKVRDDIDFSAKPVFISKKAQLGIKLNDCNPENIVLQYAIERKIPKRHFDDIYCVEDLRELTSQFEKYEHLSLDYPALIIPFFNKEGNYSHISCRIVETADKPSPNIRYMTLELDEQLPKLWGVKGIDWNKPIYVFEGPIDAMCVSNSLALAGSQGTWARDFILSNIKNKSDVIFIFDNEIHKNKFIKKDLINKIHEGFSVVIFDKKFPAKDANDAIVHYGWTRIQLMNYFDSHTFQGAAAKLRLAYISKPLNH